MEHPSLRQLEAFLALAETLHFGRAASRLGISQPSLSRLIARCSELVGAPLFERSGRRTRLTEVGHTLLGPAKRASTEAGLALDAARRAAEGRAGRLAFGFSASASFSVLPPLVSSLRHQLPQVDLLLRERSTTELLAELEASTLDAALVRGPLDDPRFEGRVIFRERFVVVVPADHRYAARTTLRPTALRDEQLVLFPAAVAPAFHRQIMAICASGGVVPSIAMEAAEWHTIVGLVGAGVGIAVAPALVESFANPRVRIIRLEGVAARAELALVRRKGRITPLVNRLFELASNLSAESQST
jgi:DNA-binding transcriptional LysR family regulator